MAWENPVTTWGQAGKTVPVAGDFNRIEGNIQHLQDTKETPAGAQAKADATLNLAKQYTDQEVGEVVQELAEQISTKTTKADYTATISTSWSGTSAPYTQAVTVTGILETDNPHIAPIYSTTNSTAILQKEAWNMISKAVTSANTITFTCFEDKPTIAIPIQVEVIR